MRSRALVGMALLVVGMAAIPAMGLAEAQEKAGCAGGWAVAGGDTEARALACEGVRRAVEFMADCGMAGARPARIRISETLPLVFGYAGHGAFDPDDRTIVIASPEASLAAKRDGDLFDRIDAASAFRSVAAHEAAHAIGASGAGGRMLEAEYVAATIQLASLDPPVRAALIEGLGADAPESDRELNSFVLAADPLRFAAIAWLDFAGRADGCTRLRNFATGRASLPRFPGE